MTRCHAPSPAWVKALRERPRANHHHLDTLMLVKGLGHGRGHSACSIATQQIECDDKPLLRGSIQAAGEPQGTGQGLCRQQADPWSLPLRLLATHHRRASVSSAIKWDHNSLPPGAAWKIKGDPGCQTPHPLARHVCRERGAHAASLTHPHPERPGPIQGSLMFRGRAQKPVS